MKKTRGSHGTHGMNRSIFLGENHMWHVGWWFGTMEFSDYSLSCMILTYFYLNFMTFHILGIVTPTDELHFSEG